ncbi:MAG: B12-binding domain-containing radical SAM protein [Elusimicrobia bacterium]|nr:B12-binding domain-containing radical SAM protein [Elusimicrobiota bacterium]
MKVSLVVCPFWGTDFPPLSTALMAPYLEERGHDVSVFDLNLGLYGASGRYSGFWHYDYTLWYSDTFMRMFLKDNRELIDKQIDSILRTASPVIAFSVYDDTLALSLKIADMIKKRDRKRIIVFGGASCSRELYAHDIIDSGSADIVVTGEGYVTMDELLKAIEAEGLPAFCKGTIIKKAAGLIDCGDRASTVDIDETPLPRYTGLQLELYAGNPSVQLMVSRGCTNRCSYCDVNSLNGKYAIMSPARIIKEIEYHESICGDIRSLFFFDSAMNLDLGHLDSLCGLLVKKRETGLGKNMPGHLPWGAQAVIRPGFGIRHLQKMKRAGCDSLMYGIESGSQRIIDLMNKNFGIKEAENLLKSTKSAGIRTGAFFMFGFPGETEEDFSLTLDFLKRNSGSLDAVIPSLTFCGIWGTTPIFKRRGDFGISGPAALHPLFWETGDGGNTYMERLRRFEAFCDLARSCGIKILPEYVTTAKECRWLYAAHYYRYIKDNRRAADSYRLFIKSAPPAFLRELAEKELGELKGSKRMLTA